MNNHLRNIIVAISFFFLTSTLFAQNAKITWQSRSLDMGISEATTYTTAGLRQYVVLSNPYEGKIWIMKANSEGTMGDITWTTNTWKKGIRAMATYEKRGHNFLLLSRPRSGEFWVRSLFADGKAGDKDLFYTNSWEKGISKIATFIAGNQDYLFLLKPENGHAWIFRLNDDGTVGENTWHQTWEPGISACAIYKYDRQNYIALSNPENGHAWIIELTEDGKAGQIVWKTDGWEQGIDALTASELYGRQYLVASASRMGEAWSFRIDNMGTNPVQVWHGDLGENGVSGLTSFTGSFGKGYIFLTNPSNGHAWVITDFNYGFPEARDRFSRKERGFEEPGSRASRNANDLIPKNRPFFIQSALSYGKSNYGFWDIPGRQSQIMEHSKMQLHELNRGEKRDVDRRYEIEDAPTRGYVKIHISGVAGYVDIINASDKKGAHLQIYEPHFTGAQLFRFVYMGHGRWKIFNENGKIILAENRTADNGTPLQMWDNEDGAWTEWYLIDARTNQIFYPRE